MPIYLCQPGYSSKEPWRHGIQVYERPHFIGDNETDCVTPPVDPEVLSAQQVQHHLPPEGLPISTSAMTDTDGIPSSSVESLREVHQPNIAPTDRHQQPGELRQRRFLVSAARSASVSSSDTFSPVEESDLLTQSRPKNATDNVTVSALKSPISALKANVFPIRRVRHAELVLVDQALIAYGIYWLRLRWPGEQGGFGGFVPLGRVLYRVNESERKEQECVNTQFQQKDDGESVDEGGLGFCREIALNNDSSSSSSPISSPTTLRESTSNLSKLSTNNDVTQSTSILCQETNIFYPTSLSMKLLPLYDDGLSVSKKSGSASTSDENTGVKTRLEDILLSSLEEGEPVFCRICREGLHDVNYDLETVINAAQAQSDDDASPGPISQGTRSDESASATTKKPRYQRGGESLSLSDSPAMSYPPLIIHHPTAENPLLAPCDCTGSMAFVHYLCIEQWRCRSRHPGARNGSNCETCGAEYSLPPPPSRPIQSSTSRHDIFNNGNMIPEEDWLDAMPPHVLAALRRPHPWWQIGAAVVRRRWIRPFVPIIISPLVALYCRARRILKKRGVSRRRWACSLCRRRARWKCVRCLRSYYCSRQCQNVSWHIVHKHVCYKPSRLWWSMVVYTIGILLLVPGILKDLLLYDLILTLLPINFIVMGVIAGGIAAVIKRFHGIDIRGRILETSVVLFTILTTIISSGLVRGYFGDASKCTGCVPLLASLPMGRFAFVEAFLYYAFQMAEPWYKNCDTVFAHLGFFSNRFFCTPYPDGNSDYLNIGCSPSIRNINPKFYMGTEGLNCRADIVLVLGLWTCAALFLVVDTADRHQRGRRAIAAHRGRPHLD